jgi:hypothetical protein
MGSEKDLRKLGLNLLSVLDRKRLRSPDRPLVFICHSTGGLVVREALNIARNISRAGQGQYSDILRHCIAITFFGTFNHRYNEANHTATPHQGSRALSDASLLTGLKERLNMDVEFSEPFQSFLSPDNIDLSTQLENLSQIARDMKIWSFAESKETELRVLSEGTPGLTKTIVSCNQSNQANLRRSLVSAQRSLISLKRHFSS